MPSMTVVVVVACLSCVVAAMLISSSAARPWDDDVMRGFVDAFDAAAPASRPPPPRYRQWDRYRANSSLVGLRVPCSARQKRCLARSELWDAGSTRCVRLGAEASGRDVRCRWALDVAAVRGHSGVLAACVPLRTPRCLWGYTMAFDNRCVDGFTLFAKICAQSRGLEPGVHASGGVECLCSGAACDFVEYENESEEEYGTMAEDEEDAEEVEGEEEDEDALLLWCHLPPLHALLVPPTEAPAVAEDFRYHFDHSHEREH